MTFEIKECSMEDAIHIYNLNCEEMGYEYPLAKTRKKHLD